MQRWALGTLGDSHAPLGPPLPSWTGWTRQCLPRSPVTRWMLPGHTGPMRIGRGQKLRGCPFGDAVLRGWRLGGRGLQPWLAAGKRSRAVGTHQPCLWLRTSGWKTPHGSCAPKPGPPSPWHGIQPVAGISSRLQAQGAGQGLGGGLAPEGSQAALHGPAPPGERAQAS